ncbi:hypothetical protein [Nocardia tengchongensis]|uniref:hypothetical protein n=1 Tax=Nocardia tengchongensis TaxID=2055889 RepID=UPI0036B7FD23
MTSDVALRVSMGQWDRFTEDLAAMVREGIGASAILDIRMSESVWVQMNQEGNKRLTVGMEPSMFAANDPRELANEGWMLDNEWETTTGGRYRCRRYPVCATASLAGWLRVSAGLGLVHPRN